jgi:hypothetical protein
MLRAPGRARGHGTELAEDFVPLLDRRSLLVRWNTGKDFCKAFLSVLGKLDGHGCGVYYPSQDQLDRVPGNISLA